MKRLISLMLVLAMGLTSLAAFAAPSATHHQVQHNVYIEGKVEKYVENAKLMLTLVTGEGENEKVAYVGEYDDAVGIDGSYTIKFKHKGELTDAKIYVKYADEDVTDSVVETTATSQIMEADVFVTDTNDKSFALTVDTKMPTIVKEAKTVEGVVLPERTYTSDYGDDIEKRSGLKAVVNLKNKFAYEDSVSVMVAAYDENSKLLDCAVKTVDVEYGYKGEKRVVETAEIAVPDRTAKAKAFCWSSTSDLIPYGKEADGKLDKVDVFCIGDSYCQAYSRDYYPESGWGEHLEGYFNADVTVTNYGTSGAWAQSVMNNPKDPLYGTSGFHGGWKGGNGANEGDWQQMLDDGNRSPGDYVIVSLGLNDSGKKTPDEKISATDWYAMGIEDMIKSAIENKLNIILCSPMLRANFEAPSAQREIIVKTEEIAKKYGVPFLNVNDAMEAQYAEEFGYVKDKNYNANDDTKAELADMEDELYGKYYLDREALQDENHEFHLSEDEITYNKAAQIAPGGTGKNSHPNFRGADNMARWISVLLKDSDSDLRFYVK